MWIATSHARWTDGGDRDVLRPCREMPCELQFVAELQRHRDGRSIDTMGFTPVARSVSIQMAGTLSESPAARGSCSGYGDRGPCVKQGTAIPDAPISTATFTEDRIVDAGAQTITRTASCSPDRDHWELMAAAFNPSSTVDLLRRSGGPGSSVRVGGGVRPKFPSGRMYSLVRPFRP